MRKVFCVSNFRILFISFTGKLKTRVNRNVIKVTEVKKTAMSSVEQLISEHINRNGYISSSRQNMFNPKVALYSIHGSSIEI